MILQNCPQHGLSYDREGKCPRCLAEAKSAGGRKDDGTKIRMELIPPEGLFAVAAVLTRGAAKYEDRNWEKGMAWGRVFGALMRHLWAWWGGRGPTTKSFLFGDLDSEWNFSHLWHAGCCLFFLIAYEERGVGTDDRHRSSDGGGHLGTDSGRSLQQGPSPSDSL